MVEIYIQYFEVFERISGDPDICHSLNCKTP